MTAEPWMPVPFDPDNFSYIASQVARDFARSFPGVGAADLFGELYYLLHSDGSRVYAAADAPEPLIRAWLRGEAERYCKQERSRTLKESCTYYYRPGDVKTLLDAWTQGREKWEKARIPDDAKSELGHAAVEMLADISRVWSGHGATGLPWLTSSDRSFLLAVHTVPTGIGGRVEWDEVATELELPEPACRRGYARALDALVRALNRDWEHRADEFLSRGV